MPEPAGSSGARSARRLLAGLVGLEATALAGGAAYLAAGLVTQKAADVGAAVWETVAAVGLAVGLALLVRPVSRGRPWARGPVLTWQLIQIPVVSYLVRSRMWYLGVALLTVAVLAAALALWPRVFDDDRE